jgi:hypothetical protein
MRRLRFRLRTLLIVITVLAVCLGAYISSLRERERAVAAILQLGGTVNYDYEFKEAGTSSANAEPPGPKWLRRLLGPQWRVTVVRVSFWSESGGKATDQDLAVLEALPHVRSLYLDANSAITDDGLRHIAQLSELESLSLNDCSGVTDEGLSQLADLNRLTFLSLCRCRIDGSGLRHVTQLPLTCLSFTRTSLSDANLKHVALMRGLNTLTLQGTPITDAGLRHLSALVSLGSLQVHETRITDNGLVHLTDLQKLWELHVHSDGVTEDGIVAIRRAIPGCQMIE